MRLSMQHRIGELLASACRNHARVGGCKLHSATEANHHLRLLEFKDGKQRSIVAYMLQDNEQGGARGAFLLEAAPHLTDFN